MRLQQNDPVPWDMTKEEMDAEIERHIRLKNQYIGQEWPLPTDTKWFGVKNRMITKDLIRNYCNCVGDLNPLFRDETYAKNTRWGGIIAPPMIIHYVAMVSAGLGIEPPEIKQRGFRARIHGVGGLNVGGTVEFYNPIRPGDEFVCIDKFVGCEEVTKKEKPVPRLIRNRGQRRFINQHGKTAVVASGVELEMIPEKPLKKGEKQIDMGGRFGGYASDLSRTICLGTPDDTFKKVYNVVLDAQLAAVSIINEGMTGEQIDGSARKVIEQAGYGESF